jgi:hypothetical protein
VVLNERPNFLTAHPMDQDHAIVLEGITIALYIYNVSSFLHGRTPTQKEYDQCDNFELSYPFPKWSPNIELFAEEESNGVDEQRYARKFNTSRRASSMIHDDGEFLRCINALSIMPTNKEQDISAMKSDKFRLNADVLYTNWIIGKTIAENTIKATSHLRAQAINLLNVEQR